MAISVVTPASNSSSNAASSTTIVQSATYVANDRIVVTVRWGSQTTTCTVSDGTAFSQIGGTSNHIDDSSGNRMASFERRGVSAGAATITATFSGAVVNREIEYLRVVGSDSNAGQATGTNQDAVAATANAVTTPTLTPANQPNAVVGITCTRFFAVSIAAGTSFTSLGAISGWDSLASDTSLVEWRRTTSTSAVAATFTPGGAGDSFHSMVLVFGEAAGGSSIIKKAVSLMLRLMAGA